MHRKPFRIFVAVFVGVLLVLGVISCFYVQEQSTMVLLAILAVLYAVYLWKLFASLKKEKTVKQQSPLARRR